MQKEIVFKLNESPQWYKVIADPETFSHAELPDGRVIERVLHGMAGYDQTEPVEVRGGFMLARDMSKTTTPVKADRIAQPAFVFVETPKRKPERIVFQFEDKWYEVSAVHGVFRFVRLPDGLTLEHVGNPTLGSYMLSIPPQAVVFKVVTNRPFPGMVEATQLSEDPFNS